jgi:hypothetical protein
VPIYDARELDTDKIEDVLLALASLHQFEDDVPTGSCAVVGHTITTYIKKDKTTQVSFNIHWVAVIGTPL